MTLYTKDTHEAFRELINRLSLENNSNTPDFILADYLLDCLSAYDLAVSRRDIWYKPREVKK